MVTQVLAGRGPAPGPNQRGKQRREGGPGDRGDSTGRGGKLCFHGETRADPGAFDSETFDELTVVRFGAYIHRACPLDLSPQNRFAA
jgi:hypothetical protein